MQNHIGIDTQITSPSTKRTTHNVLKQILGQAVKEKLIPQNPAEEISLPTVRPSDCKVPTAEEAELFLKTEMPSFVRTATAIGIQLGLRRGEVLGLRWDDIDLDEMRVTIRHSYSKEGSIGRLKDPKTETSYGNVVLDEDQTEFFRRLKLETGGIGHVVSRGNGEPINPDYYLKTFKKAAKKAGMPTLRPHDMRHAHATILADSGNDQISIMRRLRHKDIRMAARYIHETEVQQRNALEKAKNRLPKIGR